MSLNYLIKADNALSPNRPRWNMAVPMPGIKSITSLSIVAEACEAGHIAEPGAYVIFYATSDNHFEYVSFEVEDVTAPRFRLKVSS